MVAFGFAWFFSALVTANSELVFTIGLFVNNLFFAVMLHLLLAFPSGRLETRNEKRLAAASYFVAVPLGLPPMLFADTTNDEVCGCPENLLMVQDSFTTTQILGHRPDRPGAVPVRGGRPRLRSSLARRPGGRADGPFAHDLGGRRDARGRRGADRGGRREPGRGGAVLLLRLPRCDGGRALRLPRRPAAQPDGGARARERSPRRRAPRPVEELRASRARIVQASDTARRRLERDLHDGAQQRLVALALDLKLARGKLDKDPAAAAELLDASIEELAEATSELRELARGIHPALLTDRGLGPALEAIASRAPMPVEVAPVPEMRLPGPVESAAYFVVAEALTNVSKYANATHAEVTVTRSNGKVVVEVRDDGVGGADPAAGSGLSGLADRVAALDGMLDVESPQGGGTVVRAEVPCE